MRSKTSCFNKTIFYKNITHFWPIWMLILAWNLFVLPFMIYNSSQQYKLMNDIGKEELEQSMSNDILSLVAVYINPVVLFIFSVVAVMAVFSYLYQARSANTIHALPVTRKELFFTNYISDLLFLIVPEIIGFLMGILVSAFCGYAYMNHLLAGLLFACGISTALYSFNVFIAMFTGQLFAVPIFAVIIHFLYVGAKTLVAMVMSMISYGLPMSFPGGKLDVLSPLFYLLRHVRLEYDHTKDYAVIIGIQGKETVTVYVLVSLVFAVAAYLIYRIRNMESAGSLVSIAWICPIFRWGAAFCGGALFSAIFCSIMGFSAGISVFIAVLVSAVFFGIVFFFGAQMFLEKGFRVFTKKRIAECGIFLVIFAGLYVSIEVDLFGQERKIPDVSQVDRAYIDAYDSIGGSDEEMIGQVMDIHRQVIDSKREFERHEAQSWQNLYITVRYYMKNGSTITRSYAIPADDGMLEDNDTVLHRVAQLAAVPDNYRRLLFGEEDQEIEPIGGWIELYNDQEAADQKEFSKEDAEYVYRAVLADIEEGNFKDVIMNRYSSDNSDSQAYDNTLVLECLSENNETNGDAGPMYSYAYEKASAASINAYIRFDANCHHVLDTLKEIGAIQGEEDLITVQERSEQSDE